MATANGYDQLTADTSAMQSAASELKTSAAALNQHLEDLDNQLKPLIQTWDGHTQQQYYGKQQQWDSAMLDIINLLNQIGVVMDNAATAFWQTELKNAAAWSAVDVARLGPR